MDAGMFFGESGLGATATSEIRATSKVLSMKVDGTDEGVQCVWKEDLAGGEVEVEIARQLLRSNVHCFGVFYELAAKMHRRHWIAGKAVIEYGSRGKSMLLVMAGTLDVCTKAGRVIQTVTAHQPLGEESLFRNTKRRFGASAGPNGCCALELTTEDFDRSMQSAYYEEESTAWDGLAERYEGRAVKYGQDPGPLSAYQHTLLFLTRQLGGVDGLTAESAAQAVGKSDVNAVK
ncbi:hypothetical protein HDV00_007635 [Rhizophlyctis rosea]|nr:hypothetical protein HDV00_007635 [Rhizophlyctis rosea]